MTKILNVAIDRFLFYKGVHIYIGGNVKRAAVRMPGRGRPNALVTVLVTTALPAALSLIQMVCTYIVLGFYYVIS